MAKDAAPPSVPVEEQPYPVPENWRWVRLNTVCAFEHGVTFSKKEKESGPRTGNLPCLRTANVQESLTLDSLIYIDESVLKGNQNKLVRAGDIIFSSANSRELVGKSVYIDHIPFPMTFGGFVLNIRNQPFIIAKFLFWFLRYEFLTGGFFTKATQTTNIANINTKILGNYAFPLPPLPEQYRIVERIESLFAKLDGARDRARAVLDGYEYRRAAILHKAFTGELTAKWRTEHGLGMESWKEMKLGEIGEIITGSTPNTKQPEYFGGEIPFIKPTELNQGRRVRVAKESLTEAGKEVSRPVPAGTVCVCCIGATIGKCGFLTVDAVTNQQINSIVPYDFMDNLYVYFYCCSNDFKNTLIEHSYATTLPIISKGKMSKLPIPVPTLAEQAEISRLIDIVTEKEETAKKSAETVLHTVGLMKKAILGRAFRGLLGTNRPEEC